MPAAIADLAKSHLHKNGQKMAPKIALSAQFHLPGGIHFYLQLCLHRFNDWFGEKIILKTHMFKQIEVLINLCEF